jgi:hypothetical protein
MSAFGTILLKNSVFTVNEKILAPLTNEINFDARGYKIHSKARCEALGTARQTKCIEFSR